MVALTRVARRLATWSRSELYYREHDCKTDLQGAKRLHEAVFVRYWRAPPGW